MLSEPLFTISILKTAHLDEDAFVIDELGLKHGAIRADIAVLNGSFVGYKIKTDRDTLNRLNPQVTAYSQIFDQAYVIIGNKHLKKVLKMEPAWWGVYLIESSQDADHNEFVSVRP
jgi:hypothetical protein